MEWNEEPMGPDDDLLQERGLLPQARPRRTVNPLIAENARRQQKQRRRGGAQGDMRINPMFGLASPSDQAFILQNMANTVTGAHGREMDSRRASFREARRLAHERDMLLMRLQAEREARLGR